MKTVTITFPSKEQTRIITAAEHDLIASHPHRGAAVEFIRNQYALLPDTAQAVVEAVRATPPAILKLSNHFIEVRYPGAEGRLEVTQAEYNLLPHLTTVQAAKFIRDQYQLGLYEAKRCADAAQAMHFLRSGYGRGCLAR